MQDKVSSKVRHIAGFEGTHGMDKIMVNWDAQELQY